VLGEQRLLRPDEQVFEAMLAGWRDQQLSRNLGEATVRRRLDGVRRFQRFINDWPWRWRPVDLEEFTAQLRKLDFHSKLRRLMAGNVPVS